MQILHVNCNYIGSTLHQNMIENLNELGYKNQVFVPTYDKKNSVITPNSNVLVSECFKKWDRLIFDYKQSKILKSLEFNFNVDSFDCIHAYTLFTDGNSARKLAQKYGKPYVVAVRNTDVNDFFRLLPFLRKRGIQILRDASAVFFVSDVYRKQVFDKYIPLKYQLDIAQKTYVIPNGIDDFWFNNQFIRKQSIINTPIKLIYAGKIDKNKNIRAIQKAMRILRENGYDVTLTVVGKIVDEKEFLIIKKDKYTIYFPEQSKEELMTLYREHNIFVMPSFTETFGLVYVEAMTQSLPVLYSQGQGFDGQFKEGIVGYHADAFSAQSVAEAILKIIKHYHLIIDSSVKCAEKFKWNKLVTQYDKIYKSVVNKGSEIFKK